MAIKKHRKVFFGSLFVILVVSLIFTLSLNTAGKNEKNTGQFPKVELLKVEYEQCFSPNGASEENSPAVKLNKSFSGGQGGDPLAWVRHAAHFKKAPLAAGGEKDTMPLSAYFKGREHKHVYAFLFVKQGKQVLRFLAGTTRFPASGEAVISLTWDGRDEAGQTVLDGNYDVQLFYFNFPSLFNSRGLKPHKTYEKLLEAIAKKSDRQQVIEWNGMVTVDTTTPELIINAPRDGLETHLEQIETSGTAVGGIILTINNNPVTIESGAFSSQLPLVIGENTFTYVLEDCGGNISEKTVFVTRIRYLPPQVTFNASPGSIEAGQSAVLSWSTTDAETVTIDNGIGSVGINGSVTVSPTQDATYTITAVGPGGTVSEEITIEVTINQEHFTAVYGRVFDMASGSPLSGAVVTVVVGGENNQKFFGGAGGDFSKKPPARRRQEILSDSDGYWQLVFSSGGAYKIKITKPGYTEVFRKISLKTGAEGVVDSAYLTPHDTKTTTIGPEGGTHANSEATVEVIIPQGALDETKDIRVTRLSGSKALPGGLNETDNLEYPISFLFCADFGPDGTEFNKPVTIRVQNTWDFAPGTEIPYAYWDKENLKWVPVNGMAKIDRDGSFLEAQVQHFSSIDINAPIWLTIVDGHPDIEQEKQPECNECMGSSVNIASGALTNDFSVPGINTKDGDTSLGFVYSSKTAFPTETFRFRSHLDQNYVNKPQRVELKINSPLLAAPGSSTGTAEPSKFQFAPQENKYAAGGLMFQGLYPSGRFVQTGYQDVEFSVTNYYEGSYGSASQWGGMPTGSTGTPAAEPGYFEDTNKAGLFMISRVESPYGRGWWVQGLKQLYIDGSRAVVADAGGSYSEYQPGLNYADVEYGADFISSNVFVSDAVTTTAHVSDRRQKYKSYSNRY